MKKDKIKFKTYEVNWSDFETNRYGRETDWAEVLTSGLDMYTNEEECFEDASDYNINFLDTYDCGIYEEDD